MKILVVLLVFLFLPGPATSRVPCELDPFCDDADGPIEAPLDDEIVVLIMGGGILAWAQFRRIKKSRPVS